MTPRPSAHRAFEDAEIGHRVADRRRPPRTAPCGCPASRPAGRYRRRLSDAPRRALRRLSVSSSPGFEPALSDGSRPPSSRADQDTMPSRTGPRHATRGAGHSCSYRVPPATFGARHSVLEGPTTVLRHLIGAAQRRLHHCLVATAAGFRDCPYGSGTKVSAAGGELTAPPTDDRVEESKAVSIMAALPMMASTVSPVAAQHQVGRCDRGNGTLQ